MGLDVYLRQDIANILQGLGAAEQAAEDNQEHPPASFEDGYHAGFKAALVALGLSVGLGPMIQHWRSNGPIWIEHSE